MKKNNIILALLVAAFIGAAVSSCTVSRTITNTSEYKNYGDTSVVIQTKTVETYKGQKQL